FSGLFDNGCVVVATSNRPPDDLYLNGINRETFIPFIGTLKQFCEIVPMVDLQDYRMLVTTEQGVFHSPLNERTAAAINHTFNQLAAGSIPGPVKIEVLMNRELIAQNAVRHRVAKFNFTELCQQALGAP